MLPTSDADVQRQKSEALRMGELISFPAKSRLHRHGAALMNVAINQLTPTSYERSSEARRNAELREISNAVRRVPTFKTPDDVKHAASNLAEMLVEAREVGNITKAAVARAVWQHDENPSKRFDKLTVPVGSNFDERRLARLQKRTSHYAKVAEALGTCVPGWSSNAAAVRVFRNTSVDRELDAIIQGREVRSADPSACWSNLVEMLDSLAKTVSRKVDLRQHLKRISTMGGRYDLAQDRIIPAHFDLLTGGDRLLNYGPLADDYALCEHFPPIPSVPIFDELLTPSFPYELVVRSAESPVPTTLSVRACVWREVRFAIGPVSSIERAGALFEFRTRLEFLHDEKRIELPRPWLYLSHPEDTEILIDGHLFRATIDLSAQDLGGRSWEELLVGRGLGIDGSNLQPEHNYACWRRISPEFCSELLDKPKLDDATLELKVYFHNSSSEPTQMPEGTLGAAFEKALRIRDETGLSSALLTESARLVTLVADELKRRQTEATILNESAMASWSDK